MKENHQSNIDSEPSGKLTVLQSSNLGTVSVHCTVCMQDIEYYYKDRIIKFWLNYTIGHNFKSQGDIALTVKYTGTLDYSFISFHTLGTFVKS